MLKSGKTHTFKFTKSADAPAGGAMSAPQGDMVTVHVAPGLDASTGTNKNSGKSIDSIVFSSVLYCCIV